LWFGTQKGVVSFNPYLQPNLVPSDVHILNVNISDAESEIDTLPSGNLELNYDQNNIRFDFSSINFAAPEKTIYKYLLEGIDDHWTTTSQRSISYRSLPSQNYVFKVMCKNSDGIWSSNEATVTFVIHPPFWLTWWFLSILFFSLTATVYSVYLFKTNQVKKHNIELEKIVKNRTNELAVAKDKSDDLLLNILPAILVEELKTNGLVKPREYKNVSILFTDFKGFTSTAAVLPPDKLVKELNELFRGFDYIIEKYDLEKMKTIGDSYMLAGGLPIECEDHSVKIICAGLEMLEFVDSRNETSSVKWEMRVGVHSGQVVAGVVGSKMFTYDIWGDTVNIASRMETTGESGLINISAYTYHLVKDYFDCNYRGKIDVKGKGRLDMYFITGIKIEYKDKFLKKYNVSLNR
jgi:class 3 adenylate cyclase